MEEGEKVLLLPTPKIDPSLSRGQSQPSSTTPRVPPFHSLLQSPILLRLDIYSNISLGKKMKRNAAVWPDGNPAKARNLLPSRTRALFTHLLLLLLRLLLPSVYPLQPLQFTHLITIFFSYCIHLSIE